MHQVSVLFTKYPDWFSRLVSFVGRCEYSHVSISLEENLNDYYSFGYKGFIRETFEKYRRRGVRKSCCILLYVSDEAYDEMQKNIHTMKEHSEQYAFTRLGVIFCFLHLKARWKNHYFCSCFVAEQLAQSEAVTLQRDPCLYLPRTLRDELRTLPACGRVNYDVV